ncbi:MAG: sporulation protein YtfJ [Rubrivivax sp.]|nr:sporulation protein YtfJ [Rubrivivax sp.]
MNNVETLLKNTVDELDRLLNARNVLGDPIERGGATIIPIVSFGFGFGAGGTADGGKGQAGGAGAGGGIKPLGAIIVDAQGARVEGVHGAASSLAQVLDKAASYAIDRAAGGAAKTGDKPAGGS